MLYSSTGSNNLSFVYDHEILKVQGHLLSIFNLAPVSMTFRQVLVYDSVVFFFLSDTVDTFRVVLVR